MDMKAIAGRMTQDRAVPAAIAAGCDVALLCGTDVQAHAAALEALIHAVEREEIPWTRVEDALAHQRRAKERFGAMPGTTLSQAWRPSPTLRALVGCAEHQLVAEEIRRFV
jgi:beta-glucosidase-like glycosyl hydrolase